MGTLLERGLFGPRIGGVGAGRGDCTVLKKSSVQAGWFWVRKAACVSLDGVRGCLLRRG